MKKIIVIMLLAIVPVTSFSQETNTDSSLTRFNYMVKSSKQKTGANILAVTGTVMAAIGAGIALNNVSNFLDPDHPAKNWDLSEILAFGGLGLIAGSIPLHIASARNGRKAKSISFSNQLLPIGQDGIMAYRAIPSIKMKIIF